MQDLETVVVGTADQENPPSGKKSTRNSVIDVAVVVTSGMTDTLFLQDWVKQKKYNQTRIPTQ